MYVDTHTNIHACIHTYFHIYITVYLFIYKAFKVLSMKLHVVFIKTKSLKAKLFCFVRLTKISMRTDIQPNIAIGTGKQINSKTKSQSHTDRHNIQTDGDTDSLHSILNFISLFTKNKLLSSNLSDAFSTLNLGNCAYATTRCVSHQR